MNPADELANLVGRGWKGALGRRAEFPLLAARAAGVEPSGFGAWRASVLAEAVSLTLLAGSGSRWQASLAAARTEGRLSGAQLDFDPEAPRGLFPVRDFLRRAPKAADGPEAGGLRLSRSRAGAALSPAGDLIPIAAYSIAAVSGIASHVVVVRGHEESIRRDILDALGLDHAAWTFATQEAPYGKPLGHGDAAWQCRSLLRGARWVVANFGGDANSRFTVETSLLAAAALEATGGGFDLLLPAALQDDPAYPIGLDEEGLPLSFGHAKLQGLRDGAEKGAPALVNVGLRVYRASALTAALEELHAEHWVEGVGYAIPGNAPGNPEFALDNVDALLSSRRRSRVLAFARPRELSPAKAFDGIPAFERAIAEVVEEDGALGGCRT